MRICLSTPNTLGYPDGGHLWVFLNWALGFRSLGHDVVWLDMPGEHDAPDAVATMLGQLRSRLAPFGLADAVALCGPDGKPLANERDLGLRPLDEALSCDVLCDHRYNLPRAVVGAFRRSMMIDIDPGQFQIAIELGTYDVAPHDAYFTVGEWAKFADATKPFFPTHGHTWHYIPPPVALEQWPVSADKSVGAMTTISSWYNAKEWMRDEHGQWYDNSKREAFEPYVDVPKSSPLPLELSINVKDYREELDRLQSHGWRTRNSCDVSDPQVYRDYIRHSLGEFSCCKPSYARMRTGWLSDRTACYLASGKPVVIQKTGQSDLFPDDRGTLRFTSPADAEAKLAALAADYDAHAAAARAIAEAHLDAKKVLTKALERCV